MIAIDIETSPGPGWEDYDKAALDSHRNKIDLIAVAGREDGIVYTELETFSRALHRAPYVFHNGKFDLNTLITKGSSLTPNDYHHDTMLMAVALSEKIPDSWLADYEAARREENKRLGGKKDVHRAARGYSLKTLAPYFLGVDPFWEVADHNNVEYALKDASYTLRLAELLTERLKAEGSYDFYEKKLMPWARMLLRAELRGVALDFDLMSVKEGESEEKASSAKTELDRLWAEPYQEHFQLEKGALELEYQEKLDAALLKLKNPARETTTRIRYNQLLESAIEKLPKEMNLGSPSQLIWILRDYYKLDVENFQEEETTGKSVLNRLAAEGRKDVEVLLNYRKHSKLSQAFFPSYRQMSYAGRLYPSFNLNGTRTGRLSSSEPNFQQVPGELHPLFIAGPGRKLICKDLSGIEPVVIAFLSEDPFLCDLLIKGSNFHSANVRTMLGIEEDDATIKKSFGVERDLVKEVGLSILYGARWRRLKESAQRRGFKWSDAECKDMVDRFLERYQGVYQYKQRIDQALLNGETLFNVVGRPFRIDDPDDVYMKGMNTLVQGSASDMLLESTCKAAEEFRASGLDALPIGFVHDEGIIDVADKDAAAAEEIFDRHLTRWKLDTYYGRIPVKAEGSITPFWKKG